LGGGGGASGVKKRRNVQTKKIKEGKEKQRKHWGGKLTGSRKKKKQYLEKKEGYNGTERHWLSRPKRKSAKQKKRSPGKKRKPGGLGWRTMNGTEKEFLPTKRGKS